VTPVLTLDVRGVPATQGSVRAFNSRVVQGGSANSRRHLADWREAIAWEGRRAMGDSPLWEGPVTVVAQFYLPKPANTPKRKRTWPIKQRSLDLDKLARALDALTSVVWVDDAQIVALHVAKDWEDTMHPAGMRAEIAQRWRGIDRWWGLPFETAERERDEARNMAHQTLSTYDELAKEWDA